MAGVQATSGLTTTKAPFIEQAQAEGRLYIHQPYELYSEDNVRERLAIRNLMQDLRSTGALLGGPAAFNQANRQLFANRLDQWLTRRKPG